MLMKKYLLIFFIFFSLNALGSHKQGAWFEYTHLGGDSIKVSLNIFRDCNGIGMGGNNYDILISDLCGKDTVRMNYKNHTQIGMVCSNLSNQTKCNGGFYYEYEKYVYESIIQFDTLCGDLIIEAYDLVGVNPNLTPIILHPTNSYIYLRISNSALKNQNQGSKVLSNKLLFNFGLNEVYSINPQLFDAEDDSFKVELIPWQASDTTNYAQFIPNNGKSPFYLTKLDSLTGLMHFMHNQSGNLNFNLKVSSFNRASKQIESEFTIQSALVFSTNVSPGNYLSQDSILNHFSNASLNVQNNKINICLGDTLKLHIPIGNGQQGNNFTLLNNIQNQLPGSSIGQVQINGQSFLQMAWKSNSVFNQKLVHLQFIDNQCPYATHFGMAFFLDVKPAISILPKTESYCATDTVNLEVLEGIKGFWSLKGGGLTSQNIGCDTCPKTYFIPENNSELYYSSLNNFGFCSNTDSINISLKPTQKPEILLPDTFCNNQNFHWQVAGIPKNGVWLDSAKNIGIHGGFADTSSGYRTLKYVIVDSVCGFADTATKTVYLQSAPIVVWNDSFEICYNSPPMSIATGMPQGGGYSGYGIDSIIGIFNPKHGLLNMNSSVMYRYRDPNTLCRTLTISNVFVLPLPAVSISPIPPICESEDTLVITQMLPKKGGVFFVNGIVGDTINPSLLGHGSFTAYYALEDSNSCRDTATRVFTLDSMPFTPQIIALGKDTLTSSVKGSKYNWYWNGTLLSNQSEFLVYPNVGTYQIEVENGTCISEVSERFTYNTLNISEINRNGFKVYPNPNNGKFQVSFSEGYLGKSVFIYNSIGQLVTKLTMENLQEEITINKKGVYFLKLENGLEVSKIVVK